jgi:RHS repeat-associated protein
VKRTLPGNQVETYAYNIGGLLTNKTDFNGYVTTYQYDLMNRLQAKVPDSRRGEATIAYSYNVLGLRTNMTDAGGSTAYVYDQQNRLVQKTRFFAGAGSGVSLNYAYDANGNVTNVVSSSTNGINVGYEYDALNRLSAVNDVHLGRTDYLYDGIGNLQSYTYPNGVNSLYQYDSLNRLTNLHSEQMLTPIATYAYTVGASGNRLTAGETLHSSALNSHPSTINRIYSYDDIYRLTSEAITVNSQQSTLTYNYDPVGNRTNRNSGLAMLATQNFTFDPNDRLNSDTYDANGNTLFGTGFGQSQADQYDFENRLVSRTATVNGQSTTVNLWYDGDGNRVRKSVATATNTITTYYLVDDLNPTGYSQVLEELSVINSQLTATRVYTYGHTLISQDQLAGNQWSPSFYGYDGHNSVRYLTDLNAQVTDTYDYDAFGNLTARAGATLNNYLFTGEQFDPDLNLYYLRARYHNTDTGRFWSMDSFEGADGDPKSLHKYTYCGNDPVGCFDPSGHWTLSEVMTTVWIGSKIAFGLFSSAYDFKKGSDELRKGNVGAALSSYAFGTAGLIGTVLSTPGVGPTISRILGTIMGSGGAAAYASSEAIQLAGNAGMILGAGPGISDLIKLLTQNMRNVSGGGGASVPHNFGKSVWRFWDQGTFWRKSETIAYHYKRHVLDRGLKMTVEEYTTKALEFYNKYKDDINYAELVPLRRGAGDAVRITVGDVMGIFTQDGRILTFHP